MSNFTKKFDFNISFEGDKIAFSMTRMKRKDALKLIPFMGEPDENGNVKVSFKDQLTVMDIAADLLPKYITSMTGLKDGDGEALAVEEMVTESYFLKLVGDVIKELMDKSFTGKEDVKKLKGLPVKDTVATAVTKDST